MRISVFLGASILYFILITVSTYAQDDYLVSISGDSITHITIVSFPAKGIMNVNGYNAKLFEKYEDLKIEYKTNSGEEISENYNRIKAFSVNGKRIVTWHVRDIHLNSEGKIEFNKIIEVQGKTRDQLYTIARSWLIGKLGLTSEAIDKYLVEDKENGTLTINNLLDGKNTITPYDSPPFSNWIMYSITVRVKDNRSKITLGNFSCHYETGKIFDNKFVQNNDVPGEYLLKNWKNKNTINSHLYQGLLLMVYLAEDVTIKDYEARLLQNEEDW
jgi:hypothetical protein